MLFVARCPGYMMRIYPVCVGNFSDTGAMHEVWPLSLRLVCCFCF